MSPPMFKCSTWNKAAGGCLRRTSYIVHGRRQPPPPPSYMGRLRLPPPLCNYLRARFHDIPSAPAPHASPRNAREFGNRTSYIGRPPLPPSPRKARELCNRTSYMGGVSRLRLRCTLHIVHRQTSSASVPAPRAQALQSYIVLRTSYIGRPRLPSSDHSFITQPSLSLRFPPRKAREFGNRTSYIQHRT